MMIDCTAYSMANSKFDDRQEKVTIRPENFQALGNIPFGKKNPQPQAVGDFRERTGGKFSHLRLMACRRTAPS
jgi:hypothetical protein